MANNRRYLDVLRLILLLSMASIPAQSNQKTDIDKDYFLSKLMEKYGDGNEMTYEGFEHLLHGLGLGGMITFDHSASCHKNNGGFLLLHPHHNHTAVNEEPEPLADRCPENTLTIVARNRGHRGYEHSRQHNQTDHESGHHGHGKEHEHQHGGHDHNNEEHDEEISDITSGNSNENDHGSHGHIYGSNKRDNSSHQHYPDAYGHDHGLHKHENGSQKVESLEGKRHEQTHHEHKHHGHGHHGHGHGTEHRQTNKEHKNQTENSDTRKHKSHDGLKRKTRVRTGYSYRMRNKNRQKLDTKQSKDNATDIADAEASEHGRSVANNTDNDEHNKVESHSIDKREAAVDDECLSINYMLRLVDVDFEKTISKETFKELCPTLIHQIDADACHGHHEAIHYHGDHTHDHDHVHAVHDGEHDASGQFGLHNVSAKVWGFASLAVLIISLVGLLGVAVIPIMQGKFYHQLLQFLVALAVGALSGDALLHLLPHALFGGHGGAGGSHSHEDQTHAHDSGPIFKCLCGLMGIYLFFLIERCLVILTAYRKRKMKNKDNNGNKTIEVVVNGIETGDEELMQLNQEYHKDNTSNHNHGHSHGHAHGHSHGMDGTPGSVAAVAWMVIMGDGIHNFCDGLAIGAAFVSSITGGFSTSVAVFCHELPHEIGDFAMLLKSGMTAKQAIFYNCVSSVLCFIGMLVGVAVGNVTGASLWVFVVVAGMFLYISLVDMIPELTSTPVVLIKDGCIDLILQSAGIFLGAGIMLLIALYEADLETVLE